MKREAIDNRIETLKRVESMIAAAVDDLGHQIRKNKETIQMRTEQLNARDERLRQEIERLKRMKQSISASQQGAFLPGFCTSQM